MIQRVLRAQTLQSRTVRQVARPPVVSKFLRSLGPVTTGLSEQAHTRACTIMRQLHPAASGSGNSFQQPKNTRSNNGAQYRVVQGPKSTHHMPMPFLEGTFLCSCLPDTSRACSHKPHVGTCPSDTKVALLFYRHAEPCHCILLLSCHRRPAVLIRSVPTRTDVLSLGLDLPITTPFQSLFALANLGNLVLRWHWNAHDLHQKPGHGTPQNRGARFDGFCTSSPPRGLVVIA